ncbi:unnamed protein product, partial [Staurois parvus]
NFTLGTIQSNKSPLLKSPVAVCFTPLHQPLCIALGDIRLGCSCTAMETHSMRFSMQCCANQKVTRTLEVFIY